MTKMLKRLESVGFVERTPDPEDRRSTLVALTPSGIEVEEKAFKLFLSRTHDLLAPISEAELKEIDQSLGSFLDTIESYFYR
jgi:DNA-binding MarR family transcriptional regulator